MKSQKLSSLVVTVKPKVNVSLLDSSEINAITPYTISNPITTLVKIDQTAQTLAMLDSGSAGNFIHPTEVLQLGLVVQPREQPLAVTHVLGGKGGQVTQQVKCTINIGDHLEEITLDVVPIGKHAVILGLPWLRVHQPYIAWQDNTVSFPSDYCKENCNFGDSSTIHHISHNQAELAELKPMEINLVTTVEQGTIPHYYHDFQDVFDAESA